MPSASTPAIQAAPPAPRVCVAINEPITVLGWVVDHDSYRRWAHSDEFPKSGQLACLSGEIQVDTSIKKLIPHHRLTLELAFAIMAILKSDPKVEFFGNRMLLTNADANLSTEPDGLAYLWTTVESANSNMSAGRVNASWNSKEAPT